MSSFGQITLNKKISCKCTFKSNDDHKGLKTAEVHTGRRGNLQRCEAVERLPGKHLESTPPPPTPPKLFVISTVHIVWRQINHWHPCLSLSPRSTVSRPCSRQVVGLFPTRLGLLSDQFQTLFHTIPRPCFRTALGVVPTSPRPCATHS